MQQTFTGSTQLKQIILLKYFNDVFSSGSVDQKRAKESSRDNERLEKHVLLISGLEVSMFNVD